MIRRDRYLPALDGLRGLAAMWVFMFHLLDVSGSVDVPGFLGVDLFFVLSGFVLSHAYGRGVRTTSEYRRFLHARAARIYPLHFVTLLATAAVVVLWPGFAASYPVPERRFGADAFLAHLLLVQNWGYVLPSSWNSPAWSLSAEWAAYLAFPAFLLAARWSIRPIVLAVAAMVAMSLLLLAWGASPDATGTPGMLRMAFGILAGCLTYRAYAAGIRLPPTATTLAAAVLIGIAHLPGLASVGTLTFPLMVLLCARGDGPLAQLCAARPTVWLGEISYSLYLWHWIIIQVAVRLPGLGSETVSWHVALIAVTLALSAASYSWLEKPARTWVLRLPLSRRADANTR